MMINRWQDIRKIWQRNQWLLVVSGWFAGLLTFPFIDRLGTDFLAFIYDLTPEAVGIGFTVLIIDRLNAQREREQLQNRLVREASGRANEAAKAACDWMQSEGWLSGNKGLLAGKKVWRANMADANLARANLEKTDFYRSDLAHANLYKIKAKNACFAYTNLEGADLVAANLEGANLEGANIENAVWDHPNRSPAKLPDGTLWTEDTDMERFTNHEHPQFWRSNDYESYAHISQEEHWARQRETTEE